jgi:hypothetical protein
VKVPSLNPDTLPLAGEGVPTSPTLADVDGDGSDEIVVSAVAGAIRLYRGDGSEVGNPHFSDMGVGKNSDSSAPGLVNIAGNGAFGRLVGGGPLRYFSGAIDNRLLLAAVQAGQRIDFQHVLGGWDAASGSQLDAFPRVMDGWFFVNAPVVADVDGDGKREVVAGSSGGWLHAFREDGSEPAGWPKLTGGFMISTPAIGNLDGDAGSELVELTRDGWLFLYDLPKPGVPPEWPVFRHDARNSGRYG